MKKVYEGDVLEHALNFGYQSCADRYNIPKEVVKRIVKDFAEEVGEDSCACEEARKRGISMMCLMCTKGQNPRIKL